MATMSPRKRCKEDCRIMKNDTADIKQRLVNISEYVSVKHPQVAALLSSAMESIQIFETEVVDNLEKLF